MLRGGIADGKGEILDSSASLRMSGRQELVDNGEAAGYFVVDVLRDDLFFAEFVGVFVGSVGDDVAGHGGGDAGEGFEVGTGGGIDVDAGFGWFAGEAVADAEDGGLGARGDGGSGVGGVFADALLAAGAGGAA